MSKKHLGTNRTRRATGWRRGRVSALITLVVICLVSTSLLAQISSRKKGSKASGEVSVMSLAPGSPAKEYIYEGSKLIATAEPTAVNGNDAQFISMVYEEPCVYNGPSSSWYPIGAASFSDSTQTYRVRVTMKNTGANAWTLGNYFLGSQNGPNNTMWGRNSVGLDLLQPGTTPPPIGVGQQTTFEFTVRKQTTGSGFINFQWQMFQGPESGGVYFGEKTKNGLVSGGGVSCQSAPVGNAATFVSQEVPAEMVAGHSYTVWITMYNAGTNTWISAQGAYKLGSQIPQDNMTWGLNRVPVPPKAGKPGQNVTFTFTVTAPSTAGTYDFQWMMVKELTYPITFEPVWFGYVTPITWVHVTSS